MLPGVTVSEDGVSLGAWLVGDTVLSASPQRRTCSPTIDADLLPAAEAIEGGQ
ncbi:hypothetical protein [Cohnella sp. 56]|uniref:hypothetical protein n=1 Tax=Cohnella sp. 56 TaxID=3113722 RepID=UPI0030E9E7CC